jgi:ubiquitin-protein ligase E3 C
MAICLICLPFILQVFSVNGLSKYYIHQIACFLPSLPDVLPNDISANHPGYACVLANVLEAATWILSDAKFASDTVCFLLNTFWVFF